MVNSMSRTARWSSATVGLIMCFALTLGACSSNDDACSDHPDCEENEQCLRGVCVPQPEPEEARWGAAFFEQARFH